MKKYLAIAGIVLMLAAAVVRFGIGESMFSQRFPDGWTWNVNSIGLTGYPDETGQFAEGTTLADDPLNISIRTVTAEADGAPVGQVNITDHYETRDPLTNAVTWEFTSTATVDAATGRYLDGEFQGDYYFLPQNVAKSTTYTVTNNTYLSLPMTFQREETIAGINTYLFGHYEAIDDTLANMSLVALEPGQQVWCFDFSLEYWVEPRTGEIVKFREWCDGDWVIDPATNERLYAVSRWGAETTGDDLIMSASRVSSQLNTYNWVAVYLPLLLLGVGSLMLGLALYKPNRTQSRQSSVKATA